MVGRTWQKSSLPEEGGDYQFVGELMSGCLVGYQGKHVQRAENYLKWPDYVQTKARHEEES